MKRAAKTTFNIAVMVAIAAVFWVFSGATIADLRHFGTPHNEIEDGGRVIRIPAPGGPAVRTLPTVTTEGDGEYAFLIEDSQGPVFHDPCRALAYVIDPTDAPPGAEQLVFDAVQRVSAASGLAFSYEGTTMERADMERDLYQEERYGDRWAPIIVGWSNERDTLDLAGTVTGVGGTNALPGVYGDDRWLASGFVIMDSEDIFGMLATKNGNARATAVIMHEFAHALGLAHVEDEGELMNASTAWMTDWGTGDLQGLAIAGSGPCQEI